MAVQRDWVWVVIGLGANLGDAQAQVKLALADMAGWPDSQAMRASGLYRSAPWQAQGPDYINAVALLQTRWSAPVLWDAMRQLELQAGRERPYFNAPRTLDLDLLFYGQASIQSPALTLPHPRWQERAFVLHPLAELLPERVTPEHWQAVSQQRVERL